MSHRDFARPGTNINTVEGNKAGGRAAKLTRQREEDQKAYEEKRAQIEADAARGLGHIDDKFDKTILNTVLSGGGLQTAAEYKAAQSQPVVHAAPPVAPPAKTKAPDARAAKRAKTRQIAQLSFGDAYGNEEEEEAQAPRPTSLKCPDVDTAFLPDAARDAKKAERRTAAAAEWRAAQERAKQAPLEVVYSYWDGAGHRRTLTIERGATIAAFLERARDQLSAEFPDLKRVAVANLMYVKEDLIVPSHFSFHDLIVARARGKSGPMFDFSAREDVRLVGDVRVESDASHPGKVCLRGWHERNMHIFPASRWEQYEPGVDYGARNHDALKAADL
jgi:protein FAM50